MRYKEALAEERKAGENDMATLYTTMKNKGEKQDALDRIMVDPEYRYEMYVKYDMA